MSGLTPTTPAEAPISTTYISLPASFTFAGEQYPPPPLPPPLISLFQMSLPVFLSNATIAALGPPGTQMSLSPSIRAESVKPHDGTLPAKSAR